MKHRRQRPSDKVFKALYPLLNYYRRLQQANSRGEGGMRWKDHDILEKLRRRFPTTKTRTFTGAISGLIKAKRLQVLDPCPKGNRLLGLG